MTTPANSHPNSSRKPRSNKPSSLNPNWAQLQSKLRLHRPPRPHSAPESDTSTVVLGKRKERPSSESDLTVGLDPVSDDTSLTKVLAIDCEMVGVGFEGSKSALARVTLGLPDKLAQDIMMVNSWGNVVYDEYVHPVEYIVDYRTRISGIRPKHMKKAKEFWAVQQRVAELIKGRIIAGHALHHDLKALLLSHPKKDTRDTSVYEPLRRGAKTRALKDLAAEILRVKIQQKEHCPVEDARAAMYIYNKHKKVWEKSLKDLYRLKNKLGRKKKKKIGADPKSDGLEFS